MSSHPPPTAPAVVLVHGVVIASRYMLPTAERLVPFCRVYAPDLPGYGQSYKPRAVLGVAQLADALAGWMEALAIARAHLVANSFGCQILAEFALRHPTPVDRLVLQGPTIDPSARSLGRQFFRLMINSRRERPSLGKITFQDYHSAGLRRAWRTMKIALRDPIEEKLPRIHAPTLIGDDSMIRELVAAGGLPSWSPGKVTDDDYRRRLWLWLKNYRRDGLEFPDLRSN